MEPEPKKIKIELCKSNFILLHSCLLHELMVMY